MDDPLQAVLEKGFAKVDQKTDLKVEEFQVGKELFGMGGVVLLRRFELDHHGPLHKQIDSKGLFKMFSFQIKTNSLLSFHPQATTGETVSQKCLINRFQEPRTQSPMNFKSLFNNHSRDFVNSHSASPHP